MLNWPSKDPQEVLDYRIDWADQLAASETILTATVTQAGGTVVIDSSSVDAAEVIIWLSGGALEEVCVFTNRITTNQGRTYDQSVRLRIRSH